VATCQGKNPLYDCTTDIEINNYTSTHLSIRHTFLPNAITSSPLQRLHVYTLSASRCWSHVCFRQSRVLPRRSDNLELYQLILLIILTTCFYLVLNAASKRISTNFHSRPSHKRCPRLRFVSSNWHMARHQLHDWLIYSLIIIFENIESKCRHFVLVDWCLECPLNCIFCFYRFYRDTAEAARCQRCDFGYAVRPSDGQCYGKYFVSDGPTNIIEPAKLAFGHVSKSRCDVRFGLSSHFDFLLKWPK